MDDLAGTLRQVTDDAPVILMAHEPDIFPHVPDRVALTVAGHTHGGQIRVLGYAPVVPSRFGNRYVYGHIVEEERNLVVSAGLGCSWCRSGSGAPPEIVIIEIGAREPELLACVVRARRGQMTSGARSAQLAPRHPTARP